MNILLLGGTAWLGSETATTALASGHTVTCLARGTGVPPGARLIRADRNDDDALAEAAREPWDAVIDVGRQPGHVRRAVRDLHEAANRYIFVSTGNVYASQEELDTDEDAPRLQPLTADGLASAEDYGRAKVACEDAVLAAFGPDRSVIARAGLIGGPGDPSERTTYWVRRFAAPSNDSGAVLIPDAPDLPTAMIDVRDLASWLIRLAEDRAGGIFNAVADPLPFPEHLEVARSIAGHGGTMVPAPEEWLADQGVREWSGERSLPLWLAGRDWYGMNARSNARAVAAGLKLRPLRDTLADVLVREPPLAATESRSSGLTDSEELALLRALGAL